MTETSDDGSAEFGLIVSFPDQSESFTNGFEAGTFDARMGTGESPIEHIAHEANYEVLRRLATRRGYAMNWMSCGDGCWANIKLRKIGPEDRRLNPHGLRVVE